MVERDPHREGIDRVEREQRGLELEPAPFELFGLDHGIDAVIVDLLLDHVRLVAAAAASRSARRSRAASRAVAANGSRTARAASSAPAATEHARADSVRNARACSTRSSVVACACCRACVLEPRRLGRHGERRTALGQPPEFAPRAVESVAVVTRPTAGGL